LGQQSRKNTPSPHLAQAMVRNGLLENPDPQETLPQTSLAPESAFYKLVHRWTADKMP